jgi:uncharacterized protein (DUF433 family)
MSEQATAAAFPVGTRVRHRTDLSGWFITSAGTVQGITSDNGNQVIVRWDGRAEPEWEPVGWLEPVTELASPNPPRAPERVLAPGIVISADTCGGSPRIQGTKLRCCSIYCYWQREMAEGHGPGTAYRRVADVYGTTSEAVQHAVIWQAAVRYRKERRKAKRKERKDG